jgi:hypothetical protein
MEVIAAWRDIVPRFGLPRNPDAETWQSVLKTDVCQACTAARYLTLTFVTHLRDRSLFNRHLRDPSLILTFVTARFRGLPLRFSDRGGVTLRFRGVHPRFRGSTSGGYLVSRQ